MGKPIRICHLSTVHNFGDTRIFLKQCKTLAANGYEVVYIGQFNRDCSIDGVFVKGLPIPKNRFIRIFYTSILALKRAISTNAAMYHFHDPELIPIAIFLKMLGKRVLYDVHEDVPAHIMDLFWIPASLRRPISYVIRLIELICVNIIDGVIAATPQIASKFPKRKTIIVQNFPIINELVEPSQRSYSARDQNIVYVGGIASHRGAKEMALAIKNLPNEIPGKLILIGNFVPKEIENDIRNILGTDKLEIMGYKSRSEVAKVLSNSRVGLVLFHPALNHINSQPNKMFEYMSAGLPVIASNFPLWVDIVTSAGCGLLVNPFDVNGISNAIQWILSNPEKAERMGKSGQEYIRDRMNWQIESEKLLDAYKELIWDGRLKQA